MPSCTGCCTPTPISPRSRTHSSRWWPPRCPRTRRTGPPRTSFWTGCPAGPPGPRRPPGRPPAPPPRRALRPARRAPAAERPYDAPTQTVLARTWQETGPHAGRSPAHQPEPSVSLSQPEPSREPQPSLPSASGSLLLDAGPPGTRPTPRRGSRRTAIAAVAVAAAVVAAGTGLVAVLHSGHSPQDHLAGNPGDITSTTLLPAYPGQQQRGVFQTISRIVSSGNTMVTTGSQISGSVVRQQFFSSSDGGVTWHLAPVQTPGGGQPSLGDVASRIAGGPNGWMAEGPQAIWTSRNGLSWTLAATHGIVPQQPGDSVHPVINTAHGGGGVV